MLNAFKPFQVTLCQFHFIRHQKQEFVTSKWLLFPRRNEDDSFDHRLRHPFAPRLMFYLYIRNLWGNPLLPSSICSGVVWGCFSDLLGRFLPPTPTFTICLSMRICNTVGTEHPAHCKWSDCFEACHNQTAIIWYGREPPAVYLMPSFRPIQGDNLLALPFPAQLPLPKCFIC